MGDLLSQAKDHGALGLGTTVTSFIFLAVIAALVIREQRCAPSPYGNRTRPRSTVSDAAGKT